MKLRKICIIILFFINTGFISHLHLYYSSLNFLYKENLPESILKSQINDFDSIDFTDLKTNLDSLFAQTDFDCISVGIIRNDTLSWVSSFGSVQDNSHLIYGIASITKCVTATAILQLYERDKLNLSEDISTYLPFQLRNPFFQSTPITIKMLLSHTSGLSGTHAHFTNFTGIDLFPKIGLSVRNYPSYPEFIEAHLVPNKTYYSASCWAANAPGTVFQYSNTGYGILGYIIECVTNQSLTDYFQNNIFTPLNMTNIGFSHLSFDQDDLITPYHWDENLGGSQEFYMELPVYSIPPLGCTGLMTSIQDLSKFFIAHMNGGLFGNIRVLNTTSTNLMHAPIISNYGMGWHCDPNKGQGHTGEEWGYRIEMRYFPAGEIAAENIGIIFMGNVGGYDMSTQKDTLFGAIRNWVRDDMYNSDNSNNNGNQVIGAYEISLIGVFGLYIVLLLILQQTRKIKITDNYK
jgi:CubicO group peptidase (beta-lactamase class C family)